MSTLIIEWDRDRLIVVSGSPSGRGVVVAHAFTVARDTETDAGVLGEELRRALLNRGITSEAATVVLPRSLVTLRRIQLPGVSDNELPDMVRLQAATRLTVPLDSVCMDFVPLPRHGEGREVLLATTPAEQVSGIRSTLEAAGLQLSGVQVSSFGIASALAHAGKLTTTGESVETVITLRSDRIELLMIRQQSVMFSHSGASWSSADQIEQAVRSEISRGRLAATEVMGPHTVRQVTLIGIDEVTSAVPDEITKRLDHAAVQRLNPSDSIIQGKLPDDLTASDVLAAAGVISGRQKGSVPTIDLVNPRKPAQRADNRRLKMILTVGAVLLLSVGAWKWRHSTIAQLQTTTHGMEAEVSALKKDFKAGDDDLEQDVAIQQWSQGNIDWLDEMNRIREVMGGTERLLIRNFTFSSGNGSTRGTITAECFARDRNEVQEFYRRLEAAGYDVVPKAIEAGSPDPEYATEFSLMLNLPLHEEEES
jgi:hypothetical protein